MGDQETEFERVTREAKDAWIDFQTGYIVLI